MRRGRKDEAKPTKKTAGASDTGPGNCRLDESHARQFGISGNEERMTIKHARFCSRPVISRKLQILILPIRC